ncbi:hypothetical protein O3P69_011703 [Scylla paramamosain]|uniref:Uncharacterized protein n=1 Tax=Scylla paramamosain TaxID=85552 RepID=A0AAW0SD62_SCYPA
MYRFKKCDDATHRQTDRQTVTTAGVLAHLEVRRGSRVAVLQCCSVADLHPNKGSITVESRRSVHITSAFTTITSEVVSIRGGEARC